MVTSGLAIDKYHAETHQLHFYVEGFGCTKEHRIDLYMQTHLAVYINDKTYCINGKLH